MLQKLTWISTSDIKDKKVSSSMGSLPYKGCRPNELYFIQYTSGATGIPKPVLVTAGAAAHNVRVARKAYDLYPNSFIVSRLPQYHDCGLQFLLLTIISGATSVLTSPVDKGTQPIKNGTFVSTAWRGNCSNATSFPHNKLWPCARLASPREEEEDMDIIVVDEETFELVVDGTEGDRGIVKGEERFLYVTGRGGCLAAFEMSSTIVLVAEIQRHEKDVKVLKQI
ncbi:hypothetical protein NC651_014325 [Populus alba x Populus x berolinensis]|nr:hypothetical protein NC651_014325 [Populus alba x Populus x berolinensis]